MNNILDKITSFKKDFVAQQKRFVSEEQLKAGEYFSRKCLNFENSILQKSGVIAEFKRKSPSKGTINALCTIEDVLPAYEKANASAVSVLSDTQFFGGTQNDILRARELVNIPILRKDFMVDAYQITQTKALGADVILLIAACLEQNQCKEFAHYAKTIGLNVFLEIHEAAELNYVNEYVDVVGINNRNLKTFEVDIENSIRLAKALPKEKVKVAESGIGNPDTVKRFKKEGFKGFLIGENFMRGENPGLECEKFIQNI